MYVAPLVTSAQHYDWRGGIHYRHGKAAFSGFVASLLVAEQFTVVASQREEVEPEAGVHVTTTFQ